MEILEKSHLILGVPRGASPGEIKRAYRSKVKIWHPDLFHSDPQLRVTAEEKIKEINEARRILVFFAKNEESSHPRANKPTGKEHKNIFAPRGAGPAQPATTLLRCQVCGQVNGIGPRDEPRLFLCCNCRHPLGRSSNLGIRSLASPSGFHDGETVFVPPTLDYIKFLAFCAGSIGLFVTAGIGVTILLWSGTRTIVSLVLQ